MQVLCCPSDASSDVACPTCGQTFQLFWERSSPDERQITLRKVVQSLTDQHALAVDGIAHPSVPFNIPQWSGPARFSAAAILGGLPIDAPHDLAA